jgi:hypothetical protein
VIYAIESGHRIARWLLRTAGCSNTWPFAYLGGRSHFRLRFSQATCPAQQQICDRSGQPELASPARPAVAWSSALGAGDARAPKLHLNRWGRPEKARAGADGPYVGVERTPHLARGVELGGCCRLVDDAPATFALRFGREVPPRGERRARRSTELAPVASLPLVRRARRRDVPRRLLPRVPQVARL